MKTSLLTLWTKIYASVTYGQTTMTHMKKLLCTKVADEIMNATLGKPITASGKGAESGKLKKLDVSWLHLTNAPDAASAGQSLS